MCQSRFDEDLKAVPRDRTSTFSAYPDRKLVKLPSESALGE